jgi:hypothetical protein
MSPQMNVIFLYPPSPARFSAVFCISGFLSMLTTSPSGPTISARSSATSPAPVPSSSTLMPFPMPARSNILRVVSIIMRDCCSSRFFSFSVSLSAYSFFKSLSAMCVSPAISIAVSDVPVT